MGLHDKILAGAPAATTILHDDRERLRLSPAASAEAPPVMSPMVGIAIYEAAHRHHIKLSGKSEAEQAAARSSLAHDLLARRDALQDSGFSDDPVEHEGMEHLHRAGIFYSLSDSLAGLTAENPENEVAREEMVRLQDQGIIREIRGRSMLYGEASVARKSGLEPVEARDLIAHVGAEDMAARHVAENRTDAKADAARDSWSELGRKLSEADLARRIFDTQKAAIDEHWPLDADDRDSRVSAVAIRSLARKAEVDGLGSKASRALSARIADSYSGTDRAAEMTGLDLFVQARGREDRSRKGMNRG